MTGFHKVDHEMKVSNKSPCLIVANDLKLITLYIPTTHTVNLIINHFSV
jgi:hypothetical protein